MFSAAFLLAGALGPAQVRLEPGRVLVIGLDGCRPDALQVAKTPNIDSLIAEGAWAVGRANPITVSGPCWSSILCGVWTDKHGVTDNGFGGSNYGEYPDLLTLVESLRPDLRTVSVTAWTPINEKIVQAADYEGPQTGSGDEVVAREVARELRDGDPDVVFVHLDEPDHAGHTYTYDPEVPEYIKGIEDTDANVGVILDALRARPNYGGENWLVVLTSDHGGTGHGHGLQIPEHVNIPFIVSGASAASEFTVVPNHTDVAPTVFAHLGIEAGPKTDWDGIPVGLKGVDSKALEELRERRTIRFDPPDGFGVGVLEAVVAIEDMGADVRMTTDGSMPTASSRLVTDVITITKDTTVRARAFLGGKPVGPSGTASFRVQKRYLEATEVTDPKQGVQYRFVHFGTTMPFARLHDTELVFNLGGTVPKVHVSATVTHKAVGLETNYLAMFTGFVEVPDDGIYQFVLHSDDGSKLWIDNRLVVDHDGLHGPSSKGGLVALRAGKHRLRVDFFQAGGDHVLRLAMAKQGEPPKEITASQLSHSEN